MPSIYHDLRELLSNPRLYDLEIVCQHGASVKVHRLVIFLQCPLLIEMTTENRVAEGRIISRIELPDVDYDTLYMMLQFFYGGNYSDLENAGSAHYPSYVIFMTMEEIKANLETLPCFDVGLTVEDAVADGDYDDGEGLGHLETEEEGGDEDEESEGRLSDGDTSSQSQDSDRDDEEILTFQGDNLIESLKVYCLAQRFNVLPLQLLARDRFYRTAEKVLQFSPDADSADEAPWAAQDDQLIYRSKLAEAVFNSFPRAVE
ncbi:hypothetical protein GGS24DRAFT_474629 [Hypoxylon argillaceum]|nr:hypothetical protein GGS24DRAFT_474629 [Hypoxylon argillaceum]